MPAAAAVTEVERTLRTRDGAQIVYWSHRADVARGVLLFIHGAASNHTRWNEFLAHTDLTRDWDTLRPDLRGHARSQRRGRVNIARWCDDLVQLLDAEGYARAVLVGHSLGANIALAFVHRFPQRAAALILIDPAHPETLNLALPRSLSRVLLHVAATATLGLNALGLYRRDLPALDLEQLDRHARELLAQQRDAEMERLYSSTREDLKYLPTAIFLQDVLQVLEPMQVPATAVPALMLLSAGKVDAAVTRNRALAARLPDCRVVEIACNHWILTAAPDAARAAIENWMVGLVTKNG